MSAGFTEDRIPGRTAVHKTSELASALIGPQLPLVSKRFRDACQNLIFGAKLTEWERTSRAEEAVGRYVREQIDVVAASIEAVIRRAGVEMAPDEISAVFASLVPDIGSTRTFVYQTLQGFGIPGTPGVGIEFDNAFRDTTALHTASLRLLGARGEAAKHPPEEVEGMANTRKQRDAVGPSLDHQRAHRALTDQLARLQHLKGRKWDEAESDETQWEHLTQSVVELAFGNPSSNLTKFYGARSAGSNSYLRMDERQKQANYELRIREHEALLKSLIAEKELFLPSDVKGAYDSGDEYAFYRDLSSLVAAATREIFIVDAYLDENVFDLYVSKAPASVAVRLLSNSLARNVSIVASMYAKKALLELRTSASIHDRAIYIDGRGWVVGQSLKDAAKKKPTYLVELDEPVLSATRTAYENIWSNAAVVV